MASGQVLDWNDTDETGLILGDDKVRYPFQGAQWQGKRAPRAGDVVDFEVADGKAASIYIMQSASASLSDVAGGLKDGATKANEAMQALAKSPQADQVRGLGNALPPWARDLLAQPTAFYSAIGLISTVFLPYIVMAFFNARVRFGFFETALSAFGRFLGDERWLLLVRGMSTRNAGDGLILYMLLQLPALLVPIGLALLLWRALKGTAGVRLVRRISITSLVLTLLPPVLMAGYVSRDYSTAFAIVAGDFRVGLGWLVLVASLGALLASTYRQVPTPLGAKKTQRSKELDASE
ncbi:MAG: hypothetical protein AAF641_12145 [Pseudomonadota bacterium]